jgi:MoxR-like ATPase
MIITEVPEILKICLDANETLLMEGSHGIGKSQIAAQFSEAENVYNETLFLSHQEVGDLIGMPRTVEAHGEIVTTWTKPNWLQNMERAVMGNTMKFEDLVFKDIEFKEYVEVFLKEKISTNTKG